MRMSKTQGLKLQTVSPGQVSSTSKSNVNSPDGPAAMSVQPFEGEHITLFPLLNHTVEDKRSFL